MKKKTIWIICGAALALGMVIAGAVLSLPPRAAAGDPAPAASPAPSAPPAAVDTPAPAGDAAYRRGKLDEVNDMVLRREIVPGDYLRYLPGEVAEKVEEYNAATADLKGAYWNYFRGVAEGLASEYFTETAGDRPSQRYYDFIDTASTLALFPNSGERMVTHPHTSFPAWQEMGGSGGLWATDVLHTALGGPELPARSAEYFALIDDLLALMDGVRADG